MKRAVLFVAMVLCAATASAGSLNPIDLLDRKLEPLRYLTRAGAQLYSASDYDGALLKFNEAELHAPESGLLHYNIGTTLHRQGKHEEAIKAFQQALRQADDGALVQRTWYNLGNTYFLAGTGPAGVPSSTEELAHWENAIKAYEKALDLDPNDQDAKFNLELVRRRLKQLLDMQKPLPESVEQKKKTDELVAQRRYGEALQIMQSVLAHDPGAKRAYEEYTSRLTDVVEIVEGPVEHPAEPDVGATP